jgi:hypothetical protein
MLQSLGAQTAQGELFTESDHLVAEPEKVVLGYNFWAERLQAPSVRRIRVDGRLYHVAGVLKRSARVPGRVDVWMPERDPRLTVVALHAAAADPGFEVSARGDGLESAAVQLRLMQAGIARVQVPAGTLFKPRNRAMQTMVARKTVSALLRSQAEVVELQIPVACANMRLDTPGSENTFTVLAPAEGGDLAKLLVTNDFGEAPFRVQQYAIWTITDNPHRSGYVGIGSYFSGEPPDREELASVRQLFAVAGIDHRRYRALR